MHHRLLELIHCPTGHSDLELSAAEQEGDEITSGTLDCRGCEREWSILRGIPRFIEGISDEADLRKVYADSFGHQWTTYDWLRDEDEEEFFTITDLSPEDLSGKTVFDAGCGGGRLARIVAPRCRECVGLDYSIAVEKAYELWRGVENAHFIQCDINNHTLKPETFDLVYSHGVLHHTPDTKRSFDNIPALVKSDGVLYVALFRQAVLPLRISDGMWRAALNKLPISAMDKICGALAYLYHLPKPVFGKRFFWFSLQNSHEIRKCCLYDWYAPTHHHEHAVEEVMAVVSRRRLPRAAVHQCVAVLPPEIKYAIPTFRDNFRLGLLLGVIGTKKA
jgi:SAM-dependent methyltransferase